MENNLRRGFKPASGVVRFDPEHVGRMMKGRGVHGWADLEKVLRETPTDMERQVEASIVGRNDEDKAVLFQLGKETFCLPAGSVSQIEWEN